MSCRSAYIDAQRIYHLGAGIYVPPTTSTDPAPATAFATSTPPSCSTRDYGVRHLPQPWIRWRRRRASSRAVPSANGTTLSRAKYKRILQRYKELQEHHRDPGMDELSEEDKRVVGRARRIQRFMSQPLPSPRNSRARRKILEARGNRLFMRAPLRAATSISIPASVLHVRCAEDIVKNAEILASRS